MLNHDKIFLAFYFSRFRNVWSLESEWNQTKTPFLIYKNSVSFCILSCMKLYTFHFRIISVKSNID